jgi:hypothetical protein
MVDPAALHALTVELHAGFLFLAAAAIVLTALGLVFLRFWPTKGGKLSELMRTGTGYLEPTGVVAAIFGVLALLLSAFTGMGAWGGTGAVLDNPITRNKIILTSIITVLWALVVLTRLRFGRALWRVPLLATLYVGATIVAFALTSFTGSMGAHLGQGGSILDPVLQALGIDYASDLLLGSTTALIIAALSVVVIIACLVVSRRRGWKMADLVRESSEKSRWPGPGR